MILQEIISRISPVEVIGTADINVTGVNIDSRSIEKGHLSPFYTECNRIGSCCHTL